jgi:hypothetical protein
MNKQEDEELKEEFKRRFVADDGEELPSAVPPPEQKPIDIEAAINDAEKYGSEGD